MARAVAKQRRKKAQKAAPDGLKRCSDCGEEKPVSDFYRDRHRSDGFKNICKDCDGQRSHARKVSASATAPSASESSHNASHPADANRPTAFFTYGGKRKSKAENKAEKEHVRQAQNDGKEPPHVLTAYEAENFRERLFGILVSLWELADKGLTATALDGAECDIWRSIDDEDTSFLVDRIIAKGRQNAFIGAQVRMLIDHWSDARMVAILGPRVLESAGWHQAHGLNVAFAGINVQAPPKPRRGRTTAQNGHQAGTTGYGPTQPYQPSGSEGAMYGAQ